jgi:hypothetical protein
MYYPRQPETVPTVKTAICGQFISSSVFASSREKE